MPTSGLGSTAARLALWRLAVIFHFHNLFQIDCGALWPEPMSPWSWARLLGSTVNRKNEKHSNRQMVVPCSTTPYRNLGNMVIILVICFGILWAKNAVHSTSTYTSCGTLMRAERRKRIVIFQEKHTMTFMSFSHRNLSAGISGEFGNTVQTWQRSVRNHAHTYFIVLLLKTPNMWPQHATGLANM